MAMWQNTKRVFLDSVEHILNAAAQLLPSVLAMLVIFIFTLVLAIAVRSVVRRLCNKLALDRRLRDWGVAPVSSDSWASPTKLLTRISFWTVLLLGLFLGLSRSEEHTSELQSLR